MVGIISAIITLILFVYAGVRFNNLTRNGQSDVEIISDKYNKALVLILLALFAFTLFAYIIEYIGK